MSRTPEVIIVKWRKFFHDLFSVLAGLSGVVALVAFLLGGSFFLALAVAVGSGFAATKIKFKLVKKFEVGGFEWA